MVVNILKTHEPEAALIEAACWTLESLSQPIGGNPHRLLDTNAYETIISVMKNYGNIINLVEASCLVIKNLIEIRFDPKIF